MKEKNKKEETIIKEQKKSRRCSNYPSRTFEEALQIADGIWECASGQKVRRLTLFDHLGKSPDSGNSRTLVTASSKYGITVGGYQAEHIELTELGGIASNSDSSEVERISARFELAVNSNEYFKGLYEAFKGNKMPSAKVLEDTARELGIDANEAKGCVETFISNAKFIGLIQVLAGAQRLLSIEHLIEEMSKGHKIDNCECKENKLSVDKSEKSLTQTAASSNDESEYDKVCFYITPIGDEDSDIRKHSDLMLENIVAPALEEFGLNVVRADKISKPGMITKQILKYITNSKLVIADLSFHNPNVFYELAIRHTKGLPTVHLIRAADSVPFDISGFRTIKLDMSSIFTLVPQLETYKSEIAAQVRNILSEENIDNPVYEFLNK